MFNKIIGFEEAWERVNKLYTNTFFLVIGSIWLGFLFKRIHEYDIEEVNFFQRKIGLMEQKNIAN